jgi:hypothetical protein
MCLGRRSESWCRYLCLLALFVLLNTAFQLLSLKLGFKRHLFSAEMLFALVLMTFGMRWLGAVAFAVSVALELSLGMVSVFFLFEPWQLVDMSEFLLEARPTYLALLIAASSMMVAGAWLLFRVSSKIPWRPYALGHVLIALILLQAQWVLSQEQQTFFSPTLADREHLLFGSSAPLAREVMAINRSEVIGNGPDDAEYLPIQHASAVRTVWPQGLPKANRILFVVAESWGQPKDPGVLQEQLKPIAGSSRVQGLSLTKVHALGATAAAELRELCGILPTRLNFRKLTASAVGDCLPRALARSGYRTVGLHGAHGLMYRRLLWWPEIGLNEMLFREALPSNGSVCYSFPGFCDIELFSVIKQQLASERIFLYWLTLNSHVPYDRRDVTSYRESLCQGVLGATYPEQLCNYQNLHVQFFEGLARLIEDDSMAGVEVVVVGDHAPVFDDGDTKLRFERNEVPLLHFIVAGR